MLTTAAAAAAALRIEPRAKGMHVVSARLQINTHLSFYFQTGSHSAVQAELELIFGSVRPRT